MDIEKIKKSIKGEIGKYLVYYEITDSTNNRALQLSEIYPNGTIVIADCQTKGKGRLGRSWFSPPGSNIYLSIILKTPVFHRKTNIITFMASVASVLALRNYINLNVLIKWPNDLIVSKKKLGGILTELKFEIDTLIAIVGVGINVNIDVEQFPEEFRNSTTSIKNETKNIYPREDLIIEILNEMDKWFNIYKQNNIKEILEEWKTLNATLGKKVLVFTEGKTLEGIAESADDEGFLLLKLPTGDIKKIISGDVRIIFED